MKKTMILLMVGVLAFALGATNVLGILPDNTTINFQGNDNTFVTTGVTASAQGGNITNMSFDQQVQSSYWHAFYGAVVKTIFLADDTPNTVYDWGSQALGGWVYFANDTSIDWTTVTAGDAGDAANEDTTLGLTGDAEAVASTFTITSHSPIADVGGTIAGNTSIGVNTTSNTNGDVWSTVLLRGSASATSAAIYAGEVVQGSFDNYAGATTDYQIMVPVAQTNGLRTYSVYAGLE